MSSRTRTDITLDDRYLREEGTVYLRGIQALVRLPLDQSRRDKRAGLRIGTSISGYPGSPLGGYDLALRRARHLLPAPSGNIGRDVNTTGWCFCSLTKAARVRDVRAVAVLNVLQPVLLPAL